MVDGALLTALTPIVLLLALGVLAAIFSRELRLSPIVGYLALGVALGATGMGGNPHEYGMLAELGVVFLLFDIGLHFSFHHIREQARDIFGFGPVQVAFSTLGLGLIGMAFGLPAAPAFLVGATLALSSTAVVAGIIAERHQQNCPVGLTATAILVFQDVAAIFLLILANALGDGSAVLATTALALLKAIAAFGVAMLLSRFLVKPFFDLVARTRNEEVFTATALLVALAAALVTGKIGLSLTLGAFLGGTMLSETPYRPVIQSEIKPFRGLLLGFFFISVGLTIDVATLMHDWVWVVLGAAVLIAVKAHLNAAASLVFRWSVPGSTQLGFLLAQGSEFAFVLLSLPAIRALVGAETCAILISAVALSLALTPSLAELGRSLAGRMRARRQKKADAELVPRGMTGPVLIVGMGPRGRTIADALNEFEIGYAGVEPDPRRLREAIADGYDAVFGNTADPRLWEPVSLAGRRILILTEPSLETAAANTPLTSRRFPNLKRLAIVGTAAEAASFRDAGLLPVIETGRPDGLDTAIAVLTELGADPGATALWSERQRARVLGSAGEALAVA